MAEPSIDVEAGEVKWWRGYGPVPVEPYSGDCLHTGQAVIAWGWDWKHYELVMCGLEGPDGFGCHARAWSDERGRATTPWMQPVRKD